MQLLLVKMQLLRLKTIAGQLQKIVATYKKLIIEVVATLKRISYCIVNLKKNVSKTVTTSSLLIERMIFHYNLRRVQHFSYKSQLLSFKILNLKMNLIYDFLVINHIICQFSIFLDKTILPLIYIEQMNGLILCKL